MEQPIKIDRKKLPVPPHRSGGAPRKYPFATMAVGDSFTVPRLESTIQALHGSAKCAGVKCSVRKEGDSYRAWRIA